VIVENVHKFCFKLFGNFVRVTACIITACIITGVLIGERKLMTNLSLLSRKFIHKYKIRQNSQTQLRKFY